MEAWPLAVETANEIAGTGAPPASEPDASRSGIQVLSASLHATRLVESAARAPTTSYDSRLTLPGHLVAQGRPSDVQTDIPPCGRATRG